MYEGPGEADGEGGTGGAPVPAAVAVAQVRSGLDHLIGADPARLSDPELSELGVELVRLRSLFDAAASRVLGAYAVRGAWANDGSLTPAARLAREARCHPATPGRYVRLGSKLARMDTTRKALEAGEIAVDAAAALVGANTEQRAQVFARDEQLLVDDAKTLTYRDLAKAVRYWTELADDEVDGVDPEGVAHAQRERRGLDLHRNDDGTLTLKGLLDPVAAEIVKTAVDRVTDELFKTDWQEAKAAAADDPLGMSVDDVNRLRTPRQRRADALAQLCRDGQAVPPGHVVPRPLLSILVGHGDLKGPVRESFNGTVLTSGQVASLLTEADIERVVFGGRSRVIDLGVRTRFFTGGLRRVIEIRDRQCQFPGCDVPAERCDVDHVVEHCDGGLTVQDNGRLLCPEHNRQRPGRIAASDLSADRDGSVPPSRGSPDGSLREDPCAGDAVSPGDGRTLDEDHHPGGSARARHEQRPPGPEPP